MIVNTIPHTLQLTEAENRVLCMYADGEFSGAEIALALGVTPQNVSALVHKARARNGIRSRKYLFLQYRLARMGERRIQIVEWDGTAMRPVSS